MSVSVSAIITTYNRACYLEKAINSVLDQSYKDFELLILDNSSTDGTEAVVNRYNDDRIRYIRHEPMNISQTRNLGVRLAKGEWIAFLDDDDEWLPNKLSAEISLFNLSSSDTALVYGGFIRVDSNGKTLCEYQSALHGSVLKDLLMLHDDFTGSASNPMLKKSAVLALNGFDENVKTGEDWEFYLRLAEKYKVAVISEPIVRVRHHHGARLGDRLKDYIDLEMKVMDRFERIFQSDIKLRSFYLQRLGGKYIRLGNTREGFKYLFKSIYTNIFNGYAYLQVLSAVFGQQAYNRCHQWYLNIRRPFRA